MLNIGTASQLAIVCPNDLPFANRSSLPSLMVVPYFSGNQLKVAASLSGGNVIATFVIMLREWLEAIGIDRKTVEDVNIYERVIACGAQQLESTLKVDPVWWGERHIPEGKGSVTNMGPDNLSFFDWCSALHRGVVENLKSMMPENLLIEHKVS